MVDIGHISSRIQTPLMGTVSASATDFPVASTARFVVPCAILIGHKDTWHDPTIDYAPEIAWCTEVVDGTTLRCLLSDRGISGTAARLHDGTTGDLSVTQIFDEENWERLRAELAGVARIEMGTYTGDGALSRDIVLPFDPGYVAISWNGGGQQRTAFSGAAIGSGVLGLFLGGGSTILQPNQAYARPELAAGKFIVGDSGATGGLNFTGNVYSYTAIGLP